MSSLARRGTGAWQGLRVLVTGHSGFVGSWFSLVLEHLGADVVGFASQEDPVTARRADALGQRGIRTVVGDVRDRAAVAAVMRQHDPEVIVHLAAQPIVAVAQRSPASTFETNVLGSLNVLDLARARCGAVIIHVSSDKCYRNLGVARALRENDPLGSPDPYSASKAAAEMVFEAYAALMSKDGQEVRSASVRLGNVVGGGDRADRLVPNAVKVLRAGGTLALRQGQGAMRPWQHVLDVSHGLRLLAEALIDGTVTPGQVWNFAPPGGGESVGHMVDALCREWGEPIEIADDEDNSLTNVTLVLDGRRASQALAWRHLHDLDGAARAVAAWERRVGADDEPLKAMMDDVAAFLAAVDGDGSFGNGTC